MRILRVLSSYWLDKRLAFTSREALECHQQRRLKVFRERLLASSPYYARFADLPMNEWPEMDKRGMLSHFDEMNTAGLKLPEVFDTAMAAERSRDFNSRLGDVNVGLSSGTSGQRGVFAISDRESAKWAGIMLARMLPNGLFAGERVALFLRANSNVYESVQSRWLTFRFFDLFDSFEMSVEALKDYQASIIVAPAQVLRELALRIILGETKIQPKKIISVAEVLEPLDRKLIEQAFGQVHEVYQATEGFLASTCAHGTLHLNEEYVHIQPRWLDVEQRRFIPVITDFTRLTQPFVRYCLNDVLVACKTACACGRVTLALDAIEGRCDDALTLPGKERDSVTVFSDLLSRIFARHLPLEADYRLIQTGRASLRLHASIDGTNLKALKDCLCETFEQLGIDVGIVMWELHPHVPVMDAQKKRRRIIREQYA